MFVIVEILSTYSNKRDDMTMESFIELYLVMHGGSMRLTVVAACVKLLRV